MSSMNSSFDGFSAGSYTAPSAGDTSQDGGGGWWKFKGCDKKAPAMRVLTSEQVHAPVVGASQTSSSDLDLLTMAENSIKSPPPGGFVSKKPQATGTLAAIETIEMDPDEDLSMRPAGRKGAEKVVPTQGPTGGLFRQHSSTLPFLDSSEDDASIPPPLPEELKDKEALEKMQSLNPPQPPHQSLRRASFDISRSPLARSPNPDPLDPRAAPQVMVHRKDEEVPPKTDSLSTFAFPAAPKHAPRKDTSPKSPKGKKKKQVTADSPPSLGITVPVPALTRRRSLTPQSPARRDTPDNIEVFETKASPNPDPLDPRAAPQLQMVQKKDEDVPPISNDRLSTFAFPAAPKHAPREDTSPKSPKGKKKKTVPALTAQRDTPDDIEVFETKAKSPEHVKPSSATAKYHAPTFAVAAPVASPSSPSSAIVLGDRPSSATQPPRSASHVSFHSDGAHPQHHRVTSGGSGAIFGGSYSNGMVDSRSASAVDPMNKLQLLQEATLTLKQFTSHFENPADLHRHYSDFRRIKMAELDNAAKGGSTGRQASPNPVNPASDAEIAAAAAANVEWTKKSANELVGTIKKLQRQLERRRQTAEASQKEVGKLLAQRTKEVRLIDKLREALQREEMRRETLEMENSELKQKFASVATEAQERVDELRAFSKKALESVGESLKDTIREKDLLAERVNELEAMLLSQQNPGVSTPVLEEASNSLASTKRSHTSPLLGDRNHSPGKQRKQSSPQVVGTDSASRTRSTSGGRGAGSHSPPASSRTGGKPPSGKPPFKRSGSELNNSLSSQPSEWKGQQLELQAPDARADDDAASGTLASSVTTTDGSGSLGYQIPQLRNDDTRVPPSPRRSPLNPALVLSAPVEGNAPPQLSLLGEDDGECGDGSPMQQQTTKSDSPSTTPLENASPAPAVPGYLRPLQRNRVLTTSPPAAPGTTTANTTSGARLGAANVANRNRALSARVN